MSLIYVLPLLPPQRLQQGDGAMSQFWGQEVIAAAEGNPDGIDIHDLFGSCRICQCCGGWDSTLSVLAARSSPYWLYPASPQAIRLIPSRSLFNQPPARVGQILQINNHTANECLRMINHSLTVYPTGRMLHIIINIHVHFQHLTISQQLSLT